MTSTGMPSCASGNSATEDSPTMAAANIAACATPETQKPGSEVLNFSFNATCVCPLLSSGSALIDLGHEGDALVAGGRYDRHHLGDAPVIHLLVAAHEDALVEARLRHFGELADDGLVGQLGLAEKHLAVGLDRQRHRRCIGIERRGLGLR